MINKNYQINQRNLALKTLNQEKMHHIVETLITQKSVRDGACHNWQISRRNKLFLKNQYHLKEFDFLTNITTEDAFWAYTLTHKTKGNPWTKNNHPSFPSEKTFKIVPSVCWVMFIISLESGGDIIYIEILVHCKTSWAITQMNPQNRVWKEDFSFASRQWKARLQA